MKVYDYYKTTKNVIFTIVPRVITNSGHFNGRIELAYLDERGDITLFSLEEGHAYSDYSFYYSKTRPVKTELEINDADRLFEAYLSIPGGEGCEFVIGKRLRKVRKAE